MNETERNQLRSYIIQLRRISAHREQGAEAEIRCEYQKVLNKLRAIVSKYYAIYGNIDDSTMTRADLESASSYNNFLQDVVNNLDGINKPVENQIRQTIEDTYTTCYNGMVNAVKKSTGNSDLGILLSGLSATTPETVKNIIENPMDNLTLSTVLNRKRSQVVSDIKKNLSVGLANGDSYAKMAQRISKSLDNDYKKAMRIVRTESNRAINKGFQDVSDEASDMLLGSDYVEVKEWCSMEDESVRDTHNHLNGKKIHVQDEFESKGRKAKCPCGFGVPEEDINCRCFLAYEFMSREEFLKQGGVIPDEILEKEVELVLTDEEESDKIDITIRNIKSVLSFKLNSVIGYDELPERIRNKVEAGLMNSEETTRKILTEMWRKSDFSVLSEDGSNYSIILNIIRISEKCLPGTVAHETFHAIYYQEQLYKPRNFFMEPLKKDWNRIIEKSNGNVIKYLENMYPEAIRYNALGEVKLKEKYRGISDIISGMTMDKINLGYHHEYDYWKTEIHIPSEAWAQFGRINYDNDFEVQKMFSELFPNFRAKATNCLEEISEYMDFLSELKI